MKQFILFFLMMVIINHSWAQNADCKVSLKSIEGTYEGECVKGKANGKGKAMGIDSYEGDFKNGLPEGQGKYVWKDGRYFVGQFKKGNKEGKGDMYNPSAIGSDSLISGYWKKDKYVGEFEKAYELISSTSNVQRALVDFIDTKGDYITLYVHQISNVTNSNQPLAIPFISNIVTLKGTFYTQNTQKLSNMSITTIQKVTFPFKAIFYISNNEQVQILFNNYGSYTVGIDTR
jgi:hypothetical protein